MTYLTLTAFLCSLSFAANSCFMAHATRSTYVLCQHLGQTLILIFLLPEFPLQGSVDISLPWQRILLYSAKQWPCFTPEACKHKENNLCYRTEGFCKARSFKVRDSFEMLDIEICIPHSPSPLNWGNQNEMRTDPRWVVLPQEYQMDQDTRASMKR